MNRWALLLAVGAAALGGCSSAGHGAAASSAGGWLWLQPGLAPAAWRTARLPDGATLPYPPGWVRPESDPGTATAVLMSGRRYVGYLNLTRRTADETANGWPRFRVSHNAEEHDRNVRALQSGGGLRFRNGTGSCVRDAYTTTTGNRFVELACLVLGRRTGGVVIVGASPPGNWASISPLLERSISGVLVPNR